jgi:hypothetical protein
MVNSALWWQMVPCMNGDWRHFLVWWVLGLYDSCDFWNMNWQGCTFGCGFVMSNLQCIILSVRFPTNNSLGVIGHHGI